MNNRKNWSRDDDPFAALSLRDLIEAREAYHIHLMRKPNVVATALGYYRIRIKDSWPGAKRRVHGTYPRRLDNSEVRPYSWPAVLVFVSAWAKETEFGKNANGTDRHYAAGDIVPSSIYLPDGREVPVCVVEAPRDLGRRQLPPDVRYPLNNIGSGHPVLVKVQGESHVATVACLATDGHTTYALTNRHVTGPAGTPVSTLLGGKETPVGLSAAESIGQIPFSTIYPDWQTAATLINADIGLIRIDDIKRWTARLQNGVVMGELIDLSSKRFPLSLIGRHVRGYGAASQWMDGEIHGLFYRYKAAGGFESVADFFIGPRTPRRTDPKPPGFATRSGDSGTLWLLEGGLDPSRDKAAGERAALHPLAIQWGADRLGGSATGGPHTYALATCLSTTCARLNLELVRDWNLAEQNTWGALGHFSIATSVAGAISSNAPQLKSLMINNESIISFPEVTLLNLHKFGTMSDDPFVPLADVPDFVWKHGKQGFKRYWEGPTHFADLDQVDPASGKDLLDLCKDPANVDPLVWDDFYTLLRDPLSGKNISKVHRGSLPFRVWQIFDAMVGFIEHDRVDKFLCAAGVLAHYIGDACQPLHVSYLHHGDPARAIIKGGKPQSLGFDVHDCYEDKMLWDNRQTIFNGLHNTKKVAATERLDNGRDAALATVAMMRKIINKLDPMTIVNVFIDNEDDDPASALWEAFGIKTVNAMKEGTHLLAVLWESAWLLGGGETKTRTVTKRKEETVMGIVSKEDFLRSMPIRDYATALKKWP